MGVSPDFFTRLRGFLREKVKRFLCQQRTNFHAVKLSCFSHLVFIWDYATNLILMRWAHKSQPEKLCELFIFLLRQSPASSAILFQRQKFVNHCSTKVLWSFQIFLCSGTEGTRAPATLGSLWLNQLSPALRLKWWGTDRLQTGCCGFWCCLASRGVEMQGCYDASQESTASAGWKLIHKPHPHPSKPASGSLVPPQPVASLNGPAYRCGKYSHWFECSWSVKQMWPQKAKKSFVWTVAL